MPKNERIINMLIINMFNMCKTFFQLPFATLYNVIS